MITLRKLEPEDLPFLYQWENDARAWADSDTHNPLSMYDLRQYVEASTGDIYADKQLRLVIGQDGATVGCIDLFDFDPRNRKAAIGLYVTPSARGEGVGKEAVRKLEEYAFGHLYLRLLYAVVADTNLPCTAVFRALGYEAAGHLPRWTLESDAAVWLKLSDENTEGVPPLPTNRSAVAPALTGGTLLLHVPRKSRQAFLPET